ncbi:hypothetical protein BCT30_22870 [Enterovibrio norvegicus]|uniref:DUF4250 domain-containing protein n=2 Tax=Enterovibrio norvegicus TaxID=188144 RepID=A0A1I5WD82_9GAMM|nr:DUF4250 domain-containing protein [Enterovibrio norvegicus]MCC4799296.1 DUF4250 domain-containing protein [Enterovibrio norvegicus]OEE60606.1 hypothetical protein A1OS_20295 [Enterovibrio norvegicus]OEF51285.1 hypothetical protein A1OW_10265 [Enterovibrio norvegicus]OEF58991.1 hypothetical protein A1OU_12660 [Enterovibrio norvegicus]PMH61998.1 hypothetical protein BCU62_19920 [Enterovibrio norvegicus]
MNLKNFENMDTVMLMSIVNMKLRDDFNSLEDLVRYFDIDAEALKNKLATAGFDYMEEQKQFR